MSFTNLGATPGYGQRVLIGRAMGAIIRSRVAEAENDRGVFRSRSRAVESQREHLERGMNFIGYRGCRR